MPSSQQCSWEGVSSPLTAITTTTNNSFNSDTTIESVHFLLHTQRRKEPTHHVIDIFEDGGEATDDKRKLILGDVDQTFLVVFCADFGVSVLVSNFDGKLKEKTR